ncbi:phosphoribosyltransferase [Haloplanus aerogenes]|uniref:Phosphoribosyltransferase n=1 Tax=Haloplanus aerogenes TaxID=660522 RepID=A0A3M0DT67_9EURY|nr:phosphoribosyltransferase family protein [Haloplanus aerogenes]AZH25650.1 phosphoribosyltransferase [Haloplanus aerogenes]RMB25378.1 putative phosphoribosyltransferase [Haloplanus aerogenes]
MSDRFADRTDAGEQLAGELLDRGVDADFVLAIPRGGLPLGRAVADALDAPLDIVVASKIGAPGNPEYAIGAVASDGSVWLDDEAIGRLGVSDAYVERERAAEIEAAREKASRYRGDRTAPDLTGKTVVVVDDGVATGSTALAALRLVREGGAERVVLAIPVGPPDTVAELETVADAVVVLQTPATFGAVGAFYDRFDQVSDEEAMAYLDDAD